MTVTEQEYVLERFDKYFKGFQGKKLFLYGRGVYTRAIIERFHAAFHFAAVLSDTDASGEFCGVPILPVEALSGEHPDMVILSEHKVKEEPDYKKICGTCQTNGIALYDMYGIDELAVHQELAGHCWHSPSEWERITEGYDVVTFAALDTFMYWGGTPDSIPQVREIFRRLTERLTRRNVPVLFLGRPALPRAVIAEALVEGGVLRSVEEAEDRLYMRQGEDLCFRSIRERFPGKKILHIGAGIANDGIIPRFYDIDTHRMEFSGAFLPDKTIGPKGDKTVSGQKLYREAMEAIDANQIVSFDVFDTLLMRKTLYPQDVFELTQRKALSLGIQAEDFTPLRKMAEQETYCGKLRDIYHTMGRHGGLPEQTLQRLMALELETERSVITGREAVVQLYRYALEQGKRVVLVSDMYMPEAVLSELLEANGVTGWEKLIISCEYGCFKTEGLFERLKAQCAADEGIVHIGDNLYADIRAAQDAGLAAVYIPSALELARQSGWSAAIDQAETLAERCLVGLSVAGVFQDPFGPQSMKDMPLAQRITRYGYAAAPVIMGYLTWLAGKLTEEPYDGVLFPARDGWLLNQFYPRLKEAARPSPLPEARYFYTSRHAAFLPVMAEPKNQYYICAFFSELTHRQFMRNVVGIDETDLLPPAEGERRIDYMRRHTEQIRKIAEKQRNAQLRYFERLGLKQNGRYAIMEFMSQGTTQMYLQQFAPFDLYGLYFGEPAYVAGQPKDVTYYLRSQDTVLLCNYIEMEGVMTSPEPSVTGFSDDGTPVFAKEVRSEERLRQMDLAHDVISRYVNEYFDLFYGRGDVIRPEVCEEIYGADGYHWVFDWLYDDWAQVEVSTQ